MASDNRRTTMPEAAYDFADIARRLRGERPVDVVAPVQKDSDRKPWCQALHDGCDHPDCPCGVP